VPSGVVVGLFDKVTRGNQCKGIPGGRAVRAEAVLGCNGLRGISVGCLMALSKAVLCAQRCAGHDVAGSGFEARWLRIRVP
jgi:hypothetical protein